MQASALTARDVFCRRGDRLLFGHLDLHLESGEAIHLVGPNGVGKSTMLRILAGLRSPSAVPGLPPASPGRGTVHWQGSVGLLDERTALEPDWSLHRALEFWTRIDGSEVDLEGVGLDGLSEVPVRYLSAGQTKRAALARLLAQRTDHWLLDEPLNGLDHDGMRLAERLIAERRAAGGVVVVASHQPIALPGARTLDLRDHPW